jgi:hypothetical protein
MAKKLFLDSIFKLESQNDSSSVVYISMPNPPEKLANAPSGTSPQLTGLMVGDPTWTASNKWGPIINDVSNLQDVASLVGESSMFSWIGASTMCWKGTSPLSIGIEFYLINYSQELNLEAQLRSFVKLASLYRDPDATKGANYKVLVHGGYAPDVISGNKSFFTSFDGVSDVGKLTGIAGLAKQGESTGSEKGTITLQFGHKSKISNLLLSKVSVTESTVEVADKNGGNIKPLYYRVSAQFTGARPLLTVDIDSMFVGGKAVGNASSSGESSTTEGGGVLQSAQQAVNSHPYIAAAVSAAAMGPLAPLAIGSQLIFNSNLRNKVVSDVKNVKNKFTGPPKNSGSS